MRPAQALFRPEGAKPHTRRPGPIDVGAQRKGPKEASCDSTPNSSPPTSRASPAMPISTVRGELSVLLCNMPLIDRWKQGSSVSPSLRPRPPTAGRTSSPNATSAVRRPSVPLSARSESSVSPLASPGSPWAPAMDKRTEFEAKAKGHVSEQQGLGPQVSPKNAPAAWLLRRTSSVDGPPLQDAGRPTPGLRRTRSFDSGTNGMALPERAPSPRSLIAPRRGSWSTITGSWSPRTRQVAISDDKEAKPVRAYVASAQQEAEAMDAVEVTPPATTALSFSATFSARGSVRETTASKLRSKVAAASALKSMAAGIGDGKVWSCHNCLQKGLCM